MASNNIVQQAHFHPQQHLNISPYHCKECGRYLNSAESLEVHLEYHKENLLNKWATQAAISHSEETNNNNTKQIKREFLPNNSVAAVADSSDSMGIKKSPEYSRTTPETIFGHPPTPQSYQSASSPYQNNDNSAFSPNFQFQHQQIKPEENSPNYQNYNNFTEPQFFAMDHNQQYQDFNPIHKNNSFRYHPYQQPQAGPYDRPQLNSQVSSSSPAYPPQPTPSPSPKQCDKCGYVCDSASQLVEHLNMAHPPTPAHLSYQQNQFLFNDHQQNQIKSEEDTQSEILDLDSHKVHQVYPQEDEKRTNGDINGHNPHSVNALLNSWTPSQQQQQHQQQKIFHQQFVGSEQKIFPNLSDQKLFQPHPMHPQTAEFLSNNVTTTNQENIANNGLIPHSPQNYRPFDHLSSQPATPVISSTQVPNNSPQPTVSPAAKSSNWKSNEARRPKTYNCTACNKWFTSSGHLKRHYNTTLHKNAVKSSGQPDPATLPISAHHHPARESSSNREDASGSPGDDSRSEDNNSMPGPFERPNPMPGLLQQPPNGPYDRQPAPNIHHTPPLHANLPNSNLTNLNGSPPNGEAGLSPNNLDSRGLLSLTTTPNTTPHGFNMPPPPPPPHMMAIENPQFQMYPNGSAPHVTQTTATINSLNITGEFHTLEAVNLENHHQPLPSFSNFQTGKCGILLSYGNANVGGGGPVTAPYSSYYPDPFEMTEARTLMYKTDDDEYKLTVLTVADPAPLHVEEVILYQSSPINSSHVTTNNNNMDDDPLGISANEEIKLNLLNQQPLSPEKAHIKRDYEESTGSPSISSTVQATAKQGIHKCIDCDKLFNKACYLTQHNKTFHSGDKPFKCGRCGKRFSSEGSYQEHATKHAGDKPHKCDLCPKQFNHKTDLRRHMCLHTGQKPYSCDTCGKGFIRKDHMLKHCETHFRKTTKTVR